MRLPAAPHSHPPATLSADGAQTAASTSPADRSSLSKIQRWKTTVAMSGRMLATRLRPVSRRATTNLTRYLHRFQTGGLLQADASIRATQRRVWFGGNAFHNAVVSRNASFARFLPKLVMKFARIPAMFGGLAIGAFAWVQYQATRTAPSAVYLYLGSC